VAAYLVIFVAVGSAKGLVGLGTADTLPVNSVVTRTALPAEVRFMQRKKSFTMMSVITKSHLKSLGPVIIRSPLGLSFRVFLDCLSRAKTRVAAKLRNGQFSACAINRTGRIMLTRRLIAAA